MTGKKIVPTIETTPNNPKTTVIITAENKITAIIINKVNMFSFLLYNIYYHMSIIRKVFYAN